ncbi:MAG: hypothetical protein UR29_C0015G0003 [Candidatus Woesebacteria bacterium GW2011_GWC2_33_12]|uniref:Uncharacterized protein n=1 Tax=Candidatus Woesebacteria bacterium GW2011_GWB1_33_22 TaxID=1618566 RepID=A0A0G0CLK2_9BACT|nr:MAG: hypothetical protein UR29_C0015G0003 [Candidatus Woesebacteria bacterium GW2011_GWC2_33_12]KKP41844.1 MAG: hypothetical protein UR33_C0009G0038 [Candidatus Woesebacteria bacterium GW2011_GWA2_33_20]KKP44297.1 MAG: hypothetical protein UR35_C0009G0008 [Candidatus Woesebacteria bacterium GW2011_GWB1_33_22]KKP46055.1 MAG: hypothetical protein UR37_C0012G0007 [Microgenomates group bacterium GW2011_GWC1_33_28]KKP49944.1 MAG: hypothetical protein UR41_C0011G0006 [Candidatus Woesebacteria bact
MFVNKSVLDTFFLVIVGGIITATPNHPADKFTNKSESKLFQTWRKKTETSSK